MIEQLGVDGLVRAEDDDADIKDEFGFAGREAILGFDAIGGIFDRPPYLAMPEFCPNCDGTHLLVAMDHRRQRNYFCPNCTMCWHPEFGQLRRVDREVCPGCFLCTTACVERFEFERYERSAIPTM
jgi:hypothetical protein